MVLQPRFRGSGCEFVYYLVQFWNCIYEFYFISNEMHVTGIEPVIKSDNTGHFYDVTD